jgi:queuine tRNA-ribosyltransferase
MGIGTPAYMLSAIEHGVDMFDCVLPTRLARHGVAMTTYGNLTLKKECFEYDHAPLDENCSCRVCRSHSRAYLRHLFRTGEILSAMLLSYHNLYFLNSLMQRAREAINNNCFAAFKREVLSAQNRE